MLLSLKSLMSENKHSTLFQQEGRDQDFCCCLLFVSPADLPPASFWSTCALPVLTSLPHNQSPSCRIIPFLSSCESSTRNVCLLMPFPHHVCLEVQINAWKKGCSSRLFFIPTPPQLEWHHASVNKFMEDKKDLRQNKHTNPKKLKEKTAV